jgi:hypothetical protein
MRKELEKAKAKINKIVEELEDKLDVTINIADAIPNVDQESGKATNRYTLRATLNI